MQKIKVGKKSMSIDFNTEASLSIAEKLLEQEHYINMQRIELLSKMIIKLSVRFPSLRELLKSELKELVELEKKLQEVETTSESILS